MVQATLEVQLEVALDPALPIDAIITSSDPATRIAQAFGHYMKTAVALTPILTGAIDSIAVPAMAAATYPLGTASAGAVNLTNAFVAFWASMVGAPASFFAASILVVPPIFAGMPASLEAVFAFNNAPGVSLATSAANLATAIHPNNLGGTSTTPGAPPVITPIT